MIDDEPSGPGYIQIVGHSIRPQGNVVGERECRQPQQQNRSQLQATSNQKQDRRARSPQRCRLIAFFSNDVDVLKPQLYVRPFDPNKPETLAGPAVQMTRIKSGVGGLPSWRKDGRELYFMNIDREVMAVDVIPEPRAETGMPRSLLKMPDALAGGPSISGDGERFIVTMPVK